MNESAEEKALVFWLKESTTSVVDLCAVPEEARGVGQVARVRFGKKDFPAKIIAMSSDMLHLEDVDSEFMQSLEKSSPQLKRSIKAKKLFGSAASGKDIASATQTRFVPPPDLANQKKAILKSSREANKMRQAAQAKADFDLLNTIQTKRDTSSARSASASHSVVSCKRKRQSSNSSASKVGEKFQEGAASNSRMTTPSARPVSIIESSSEDVSDCDDEHNNLASTSNAEEFQNAGEESAGDEERSEKRTAVSRSSEPTAQISSIMKYQGNQECINFIEDISVFLKQQMSVPQSSISSFQKLQSSDPSYIEVLPVPEDQARAYLDKNSGIYISKAAKSRIIIEGSDVPKAPEDLVQKEGKRVKKFDPLQGPKKMTRQAIVEMYGKNQLCHATASGFNGKKAMRKHVLLALYSFVCRQCPGKTFTWAKFIDTINRKCEQLSRQVANCKAKKEIKSDTGSHQLPATKKQPSSTTDAPLEALATPAKVVPSTPTKVVSSTPPKIVSSTPTKTVSSTPTKLVSSTPTKVVTSKAVSTPIKNWVATPLQSGENIADKSRVSAPWSEPHHSPSLQHHQPASSFPAAPQQYWGNQDPSMANNAYPFYNSNPPGPFYSMHHQPWNSHPNTVEYGANINVCQPPYYQPTIHHQPTIPQAQPSSPYSQASESTLTHL